MEAYDGTRNFPAKVCYDRQLPDGRVFLGYIVRCVAAGVLAAHLEAKLRTLMLLIVYITLKCSFVLQSMQVRKGVLVARLASVTQPRD